MMFSRHINIQSDNGIINKQRPPYLWRHNKKEIGQLNIYKIVKYSFFQYGIIKTLFFH